MALIPKIFNLMGQGIVYTVNFNILWQVSLWKCSQNHQDEHWELATLDKKSGKNPGECDTKESHELMLTKEIRKANAILANKQPVRPWCM